MEQFILKSPAYYAEYNCSFYSVDDIPLEKRTHTAIGISFLVLFYVSEVLYILALTIMRRPEFYSKPCYKIMFFMGINDVCCILDNGLLMGYLDLKGFTYCSAPDFLYVHGAAAVTMWAIQSGFGVLLAVNRCIETYNAHVNDLLFSGIRVYLWIAAMFVYGGCMGFFSRPPVFSGLYNALFFNPHLGYFPDNELKYVNMFHSAHNIAVLVLLALCYIVFVLMLLRKTGVAYSASLKESFYQVFMIYLFNTVAASSYVYMQFFPVPDWFILVAQYNWFFAHAGPAFIYGLFNKSIRKHLGDTIKTKRAHGFTSAINPFSANVTPSLQTA